MISQTYLSSCSMMHDDRETDQFITTISDTMQNYSNSSKKQRLTTKKEKRIENIFITFLS